MEQPNHRTTERSNVFLGVMYWLYNLGIGAFLVAGLPVYAIQALLQGKYRRGLGERLGRVPSWTGPVPPVWLHAVSVGEVMAATPLARELTARHPDLPLLVSTVTDTGRGVAEARLPARQFVYFPLDLGWAVRTALDRMRPRAVLLTETEIWPNFLRACSAREIPVVLVNGRISPRSYPRYRRVRGLFGRVLQGIRLFCMQTPEDAQRILDLGASRERVHVVGNLKFDLAGVGPTTGGTTGETEGGADGLAVRRMLGLPPSRPVLVAGSTHRGEEGPILDAFKVVRRSVPDLTLLLVPRHPERLGEVEALLEGEGLSWIRRSRVPADLPPAVILVDTMGELARLYATGTVVFVGGSLVPIGGHNILEPAIHARPVLFGPHMGNFAEMSRLFLEQRAGVEVRDAHALAEETLRLLREPHVAERMGETGRAIVETHRGAGRRTVDLLEALL